MNAVPEKPKRSETTTRYYEKVINQMRCDLSTDGDGLDFLLDYKAVCDWIDEGRSLNTRKTFYAVVKAMIKESGELDRFLGVLEKFNKKFSDVAEQVKKVVEAQKPSEREELAMMPWPSIKKVVADFTAEANASGDATLIQEATLLCCYVLMPPRRLDFSPLRVVKRKNAKAKDNHLIVNKKSMTFTFHEFKTAKAMGSQTLKVPADLEAQLRHWLEFNSTGWLFTTQGGAPMSESHLSTVLIRIFERLTGKKIGVDILRHSFITWMREGEMPLTEKQTLAEQMGHSVQTNELYRRV